MITTNSLPLKSRVYISGPIRGVTDGNKMAFFQAETALKAFGYQPVNPHVLNITLRAQLKREPNYSEFIKYDYEHLLQCDAIYMLPGWQHSTGANFEIQLAMAICIPIFFAEGC